jgi:Zn-dependent protease
MDVVPSTRSIKLVSLFGIRIGVHPSWFVVLFLIIWLLSGTYRGVFAGGETVAFAVAVATAFSFFASVILHELGHALVAMRNGVGIAGIDLWLFGGIARMRRESPSAGVDLRVALAGPLVTLAIAVTCGVTAWLVGGGRGLASALPPPRPGVGPVEAVLAYVALINVLLFVLNMIPGFPLDGGRVVRALAWARTGDRTSATRFASRLGRGFGLGFVGVGLAVLIGTSAFVFGLWVLLIGMFLAAAARATEAQSRFTSRLQGLRVGDVMDAEPVAVPAGTSLDRLLDEFFLRYRFAWFPVVDAGGRFLGLVRREKVEEVPEDARSESDVQELISAEEASGVKVDEPLETLLGSEEMRRLGAVVAVDAEGVLRGVVTLNALRQALRSGQDQDAVTPG